MINELVISEITEWTTADRDSLASLLIDVVEDGASIGFLPPLSQQDAHAYWQDVLEPNVILWVARHQGELVGTVQLHLASRPNGTHRAEIAKLMVSPNVRRIGAGRRLMETAERRAVEEGRTLLVLDTREGDVSNHLYRSLGFTEAGRIPHFAQSADGSLHATVLYYKVLGTQER